MGGMEYEKWDGQSILKVVGEWLGKAWKLPEKNRSMEIIQGIALLQLGKLPTSPINKDWQKFSDKALPEDIGAVLSQLDKRRGYRVPKRVAEAKSIKNMLRQGYTLEQIMDTWNTLKKETFWQNKELFMMSVEGQIGAIVNKNKLKNDPDKYRRGKYAHLIHTGLEGDKYKNQKYGHMFQH